MNQWELDVLTFIFGCGFRFFYEMLSLPDKISNFVLAHFQRHLTYSHITNSEQ